jgi:membrane protease subunit HflC
MPEFGIELADVRIKRINYTDAVQKEVYGRMISERQRIAARFRSEGEERKAEIRGRMALELRQIESDAYKKAQEIRGKAEAEAAAIYAQTYEKNPGLYQFVKTLETYAKAIDGQTTVVLSTDADVLKYLKSEGAP